MEDVERFEHPAFKDIHSALDAIKAAEELVKEAKQRLHESIQSLPSQVGDNDELKDEAIYNLYWFYEDIPSTWVKDAFQLKVLDAGPAELAVTCCKCNEVFYVEITSRSSLDYTRREIKRSIKHNYGFYRTCPSCKAKSDAKYHSEMQARIAREQARLQELRSMPYYEYLQTPEWQDTRKRAMKRASFRCQVCNAYGVRLNVHHRTYERRGYEDSRDLIVLCEGCHEIFHANGKLAREVDR